MDWLSFITGVVVGLIIMLLITWIVYSVDNNNGNVCMGADYYNDPVDAIQHGAKESDIYSIDEEGRLNYKRVIKKSGGCIPSTDQTIIIERPSKCVFVDDEGLELEGKQTHYNSSTYVLEDGTSVLTDGHCIPQDYKLSGKVSF